MSFYFTGDDNVLKEFLRKDKRQDAIREMTSDEFDIVVQLHDIKRAVNYCMTEIIFTIQVITRLKIEDLVWVVKNFNRMTQSLHKQRDLLCATSAAFSHRKPAPKELKAVQMLIKQVRKRIDFVNSIPIPENIKLTPIQDYLDLIGGKSFIDVVKEEFPKHTDLFTSREDGRMDAYITRMMAMLKDAGKEEAYKERLAEYVSRTSDRLNKEKEKKQAERAAYALNESVNGMMLFREQFFKGIRTLNGSKTINLTAAAVHYQLLQGNRGKFCILCCRLSRDKLAFRYMLPSGKESSSFMSVGVYPSYEEAGKALADFKDRYPADRAFDVVCI